MGPIPVVKADRYMEKMEKVWLYMLGWCFFLFLHMQKYFNAMCSKMRTQARGKQRDKRSDFV